MQAVLMCQPPSCQHLLHRLQGATHAPLLHSDQALAAHRLDDLRIEQPGRWPPARLGGRALRLVVGRLHPLAERSEERSGILLAAVGQEEWHTAGCQHRDDLRDHALRHGQRAIADGDRQPQLAHRVDGRPDPVRGA
jgi:hypothetical protein